MRWFQTSQPAPPERPRCKCFWREENEPWAESVLHSGRQDKSSPAWKRLLDLVEQAAEDGREAFEPRKEMEREDLYQIVTLPPTIAKLKSVKLLDLCGSSLVSIPPEIGEMTALELFDPYGSHRLHWFPYEITRCPNLKDSRVSTRSLYGNEKYRPPFPRLPALQEHFRPKVCSVCQMPFLHKMPLQAWISLRVATDVLPLLVHACSQDCIRHLSSPPDGYVSEPHQGGLELVQPPTLF